MTLEEAIKHCEEVAEEQDMKAGFETDNQTYTMSETERERYRDCAKEHRQLAEWLKELKQLKEQEPVLDKIRAEIEKNAYLIVHGVNNLELGMSLYGILQVIDKYKIESEDKE